MSDANRALAERWFQEVWNQRRTESVYEMLSAECHGHLEGQDIIGPDQFQAVRAELLKALPDMKIQVEEVLASGENVVVRWVFHGTHSGHGLECAPTGRKVDVGGMTWLKIRDGRIYEGWDRWNQNAFLRQLQGA
jgi:steroid delta-isomerase-like uncharacterized protein